MVVLGKSCSFQLLLPATDSQLPTSPPPPPPLPPAAYTYMYTDFFADDFDSFFKFVTWLEESLDDGPCVSVCVYARARVCV